MRKIERGFAFHLLTTQDMSKSFPIIADGLGKAIRESRRPDANSNGAEASMLLSGALIVHLFAMWDEFFEHADIQTYFRPGEQLRFYAFKHLRHVFAHNVGGQRKGNRAGSERISHADKLDEVMGGERPIDGVETTEEMVVLQFPDAFLECQNFLAGMALKLASGRFSVGGAYGKVRSTSGEADVM